MIDGVHLLNPAVGSGVAARELCRSNVEWVPSPLPPHVRVVVSVATTAELQAAADTFRAALVSKWGAPVERSVKVRPPGNRRANVACAYPI